MVVVFSMAEMIPQLLKVTYNVSLLASIATPEFVDTAVTFLVSFQALNAPLCLLAVRFVGVREYDKSMSYTYHKK